MYPPAVAGVDWAGVAVVGPVCADTDVGCSGTAVVWANPVTVRPVMVADQRAIRFAALRRFRTELAFIAEYDGAFQDGPSSIF